MKPMQVAAPAEVAARLAALDGEDRTLWTTAFYPSLRRGELIALKPEDVDLAAGKIHVRHGWDMKRGEITPKSRKGRRRAPIPSLLRDGLDEHLLAHPDRGRVFRSPQWVARATRRAKGQWEEAGLGRSPCTPRATPTPP